MKYTHIYTEQGNGYPQDGEEVIVEGESGAAEIRRVISSSPIQTGNAMRGAGNYIYVELGDADRDYDELSEEEQDEAWETLYHVCGLDEEE